jgi:hypothetical protein
MDISKTIAALKAEPGFLEKVGMVLVHNGGARATSRNGAPVASLDVVVDQDLVETIRREGEAMPGMFRVLVEARAGHFQRVTICCSSSPPAISGNTFWPP